MGKIFSFKISELYPAQKNVVYKYFLNPLIEQLLIDLTRIKPKPKNDYKFTKILIIFSLKNQSTDSTMLLSQYKQYTSTTGSLVTKLHF